MEKSNGHIFWAMQKRKRTFFCHPQLDWGSIMKSILLNMDSVSSTEWQVAPPCYPELKDLSYDEIFNALRE